MDKKQLNGFNDDFWNDCIKQKEERKMIKLVPYARFTNSSLKNKKNKLILSTREQDKSKNKKYSSRKKENIQKDEQKKKPKKVLKIYEKYPILKEKIENIDKKSKIKRNNALVRCIGLYYYGVENNKAKILSGQNYKKEKITKEMIPCTFRPKINKYSKNKNRNMNDLLYKKKTKMTIKIKNDERVNIGNSYDKKMVTKENGNNKYPINPKKLNMNKIFEKSKSLINDKDNAEFIFRYSKAREDYIVKKFKKLSIKDDCYDEMLLSLVNRFNTKQNKSLIESIDTNYQKSEGNVQEINPYDYRNSNQRTLINERNIITNLRNELLSFDINEEE